MDVVIVGGGVTGLFCAYYLMKDGHRVSVIEKNATGSLTSVYNAGLLTPSLAPTPGMSLRKVLSPYLGKEGVVYISPRQILANTGWFRRALKKGLTGYEDRIMQMGHSSLKLYEKFFEEVGFRPDVVEGVAALFCEAAPARRTHESLGGKLLDEQSISEMGYRGLRGGVMFEEELSVNPSKLYKSLWDAVFIRSTAKLVIGEAVKIVTKQDNTVQVSVDRMRIPCDVLVLTAGAWSRELCLQLGYDPRILPARGLVILSDTGGEEIVTTPAVLEDYGIGLAQHDSSTLRLTGFFEMVGFRKDFSEHRKKWVLDRFKKHVVKSDRIRIAEEGVGFRPCTPDQLPVIGRIPGHQNVYVASGNCRLGVTLAPATADIIKTMISGTEAAAASPPPNRSSWYDPSRFAS